MLPLVGMRARLIWEGDSRASGSGDGGAADSSPPGENI